MAKEDGSVLIITEIDTDGVVKGTKKIRGTLGDIGKESESSGKKIGGDLADSFKKLGTAIASAAIVDKLIDVGKQAVSLGSDLQEVQNVVDVTFSSMSDDVDEFAKAAAATAGLSETMAKKYVGTFGAMADSFGFAEEEAYEMSTALTQLTGDVASFYNMSQDEAFTKLKSVFTGETESLKELGVVMTQTALDAYALANGFGKVTADMTEQEKVALRYQFVMDQLSGASGDFARTQESWANQTRVLQLQWESLLGVIGGGLIEAFTPALQFINETILPALTDFATAFVEAFEAPPSKRLNDSLKDFQQSVDRTNESFEKTSMEVEKNALMAERYCNKLEELEKAGLDTRESQLQYAAIVKNLNDIYPELNLETDEQTGLLNKQSKARLKNIDAMKQEYLYRARISQYTDLLEEQAEAVVSVESAEAELAGIQVEREQIENQLAEATGLSIDKLKKLYNTQNLANSAMQAGGDYAQLTASLYLLMGDASITLTQDQMQLIEQVMVLTAEEERLSVAVNDGRDAIEQNDSALKGLEERYGLASNAAGGMVDSAGDVTDAVDDMAESYENAQEKAQESIDIQIGLFDKLATKSEMSAAEIVQNWRDQQSAFANYSDNLRKATELGLDETLVKQLSDGTEKAMLILNELVNNTDMTADEINAAFRDRMQAEELLEIQLSAANGVTADKLQAMLDEFEKKWPEMSDVVKKEVDRIQDEIDSIEGKTFYIKAISSGGGTGGPIGGNAGADLMPKLAKGTVIPPNRPFAAIVGDQTHGTNVEAPLSTIQEALSAELDRRGGAGGDINIVLTGDMAQLAHVLKPYMDAESVRKGTSLAKVVITGG